MWDMGVDVTLPAHAGRQLAPTAERASAGPARAGRACAMETQTCGGMRPCLRKAVALPLGESEEEVVEEAGKACRLPLPTGSVPPRASWFSAAGLDVPLKRHG